MGEVLRVLPPPSPAAEPGAAVLEVRGLSVRAGRRTILRNVELRVTRGEVLCLVGPSGAGKSTLLKCLNRLVDLEPGLSVEGDVRLDGEPIYARGVDPDRLRARVGILFQRPVVFPGSVRANVLFGARHAGAVPRRRWPELAERVLREAALWDEVAGRLDEPAGTLSVGQQQRLCLARTLALDPEVVLMDEPTSALDPASTRKIEELILGLKGRRTVVLVSHDPDQARRVADRAACVAVRDGGGGELLACGPCDTLFADPGCRGVIDVIEGDGGER
jgi:phosphate transport system ATP-binding protein